MRRMVRDLERYYLVSLLQAKGMGRQRAAGLIKYFGSAEAVWQADSPELKQSGILPADVLAAWSLFRQKQNNLPEQMAEICQKQKIRICTPADEEYPPLLKRIYDPPLALYYRGRLDRLDKCLAIVGARKATPYGMAAAEQLAASIAKAGITIVSGGAYGIDTAAHRGALKQGVTVAVLGCGVDVVYPAANRKLFAAIEEGGAIISEYPPGTKPLPAFFPVRNRIISGIAKGTLVVEAAEKSGSLITAGMALEEGREVYAVPGSVFSPLSRGCHRLLQQGAKLVMDSTDIIEDYFTAAAVKDKKKDKNQEAQQPLLPQEQKKVYELLSYSSPLTVDEIVAKLNSDVNEIAFSLLQLELSGLASRTESHAYVRKIKEGLL